MQRGTTENPAGLRAARQAFPFLEIFARWAWRCQTPEAKPKPATTKRFGKKREKDKSEEARAAAARAQLTPTEGTVTEEEVASTSAPPDSSSSCGGESKGYRVDNDGGGGGGTDSVGKVRGRGLEDTGVASLLVALVKADPTGDTIRSMQRWACEAVLPEEVRSMVLLTRRENTPLPLLALLYCCTTPAFIFFCSLWRVCVVFKTYSRRFSRRACIIVGCHVKISRIIMTVPLRGGWKICLRFRSEMHV